MFCFLWIECHFQFGSKNERHSSSRSCKSAPKFLCESNKLRAIKTRKHINFYYSYFLSKPLKQNSICTSPTELSEFWHFYDFIAFMQTLFYYNRKCMHGEIWNAFYNKVATLYCVWNFDFVNDFITKLKMFIVYRVIWDKCAYELVLAASARTKHRTQKIDRKKLYVRHI